MFVAKLREGIPSILEKATLLIFKIN